MTNNLTQPKVPGDAPSIEARDSLRTRHDLLMAIKNAQHRRSAKMPPLGKSDRARQIVRNLLSSLASQSHERKPQTSVDDLEAVKKLVIGVTDAANSGILTDSEANSLIDLVIGRFVDRRLDSMLHQVFVPSEDQWFLVASEHHHGRESRYSLNPFRLRPAT